MSRSVLVALLIGVAGGLCATWAFAQIPPGTAEQPQEPNAAAAQPPPQVAADPELQRLLGTPEAAMRTFMRAVEEERLADAAQVLDLSGLRADRGEELAARLKAVIDRMRPHIEDVYWLMDNSEQDGLWRLSQVTALTRPQDIADAERIELVRGDGGLWRFSASTVAAINELYSRWQDRTPRGAELREVQTFSMWLEDRFPDYLRRTHFLLPDYQWICLALVLVLGVLADRIVRAILWTLTGAWVKYIARHKDLRLEQKLWRPVGLLVLALVWFTGFKLLLPNWPAWVDTAILVGLKLFAIVAAVWTGFIFINLFSRVIARRAAKTTTKFDDLLVPLVSKSLKILAVCVGVVSAAQVFDLPLAGVLTGLGIGGIALGLAAQDTIKNFFGSVMIFTDRPFELGDRVVIDGHDGPVESVGFRSTRIRTLDGNLVTIPNGELANKAILNIGKRPNIQRSINLGVTCDTPPEKVCQAVEIVREILADHEGMDPEKPPRVYFNDFKADSLNIWAVYWYHPPDWWAYCEFTQRVNFEILRRFAEAGIEFAFPTRTVYLAGDPKRPLPPFASDAAHNSEPARTTR